MATVTRTPRKSTPAEEAWALLSQLMMDQRRRFLAVASELDLHPAQAGALAHMEPESPVPMNELASLMHCDNSNVTGIVDRLETRGLVERRPYDQDRRVKHIVLTPLGAELRERVRERMAEAPEAVRRLSAADQRTLRDLLQRALSQL
jgi:MarR family transcriptional regulator, organic hydroperoxide resistance regulator